MCGSKEVLRRFLVVPPASLRGVIRAGGGAVASTRVGGGALQRELVVLDDEGWERHGGGGSRQHVEAGGRERVDGRQREAVVRPGVAPARKPILRQRLDAIRLLVPAVTPRVCRWWRGASGGAARSAWVRSGMLSEAAALRGAGPREHRGACPQAQRHSRAHAACTELQPLQRFRAPGCHNTSHPAPATYQHACHTQAVSS